MLPGVELRPELHAVHSNDPATAAFVLLPQSTHALLLFDPSRGFILPPAQLLQSSTFAAPIAVEYVPRGHFLQASTVVDWVALLYRPFPHNLQLAWLLLFWYVPNEHSVQPVSPAVDQNPAKHSMHEKSSPASVFGVFALPFEHSLHLLLPTVAVLP